MLSDEYHKILKQTREERNPYWGSGGWRHAEPVKSMLESLGIQNGRILDFGSGIGAFGAKMRELCGNRYQVTNYEPTLPQFATLPKGGYTAVVCTHVLEHVEPELLNQTLFEIYDRAEYLVFFEIPHQAAKEILADGRNAHLIQEPARWWRNKLRSVWGNQVLMHERSSSTGNQTQFTIYCKKHA